MGLIFNEDDDDGKVETRGRPTKGMNRMTVSRNIRMDAEMYWLLVDKCRRLGVTVADGIREGIKLFISDRRY